MKEIKSAKFPIAGIDNLQASQSNHARTAEFSKNENSTSSEDGEYGPKNPEKLTAIKRRLLQQGDWATLCVTRPLKMGFMPVNERENVGKRRRLTEEDRSRQAAPIKQVISPEFSRMRTKRQHTERCPNSSVLEDISVRIGRPRQQAETPGMQSQFLSPSQESSESMLLDKEEAGYFNTPTRLPLKYLSPCLNPYTPQQGSYSPINLTRRTNPPRRLAGSNIYTPIQDDSLAPGTSRFSSELFVPGSSGSSVKRPSGIANGFLGSTPSLMAPQSVCEFETRRLQGRIDTHPGFVSQQILFDESPDPQLPNIYGTAERHRTSTRLFRNASLDDDSRLAGRGITRHSLTDNSSIYQNSRTTVPTKGKVYQRVGLAVDVLETGHVYESIEADDDSVRCATIVGLSGTEEESGEADENEVLRYPGHISDTTLPDNQVTKTHLGDIQQNPRNYPVRPTIFGQKLNQEATHIPRREESWMQFIFEPQNHSKAAHSEHLNIGIARNKHRSWGRDQDHGTDSSILEEATRSCAVNAETSSNSKSTVQTCKSTSLNNSNNSSIQPPTSPGFMSETDFLSNLSPMEGLLDEGLAQISVYNNATRTIRSPSELSASSSYGWNSGLYSAQSTLEKWNAESVSPYPGQSPSTHISMQNQAPASIHCQAVSSPDPLTMDNIHVQGEKRADMRNVHAVPQRIQSAQREPWGSSSESWME